MPVRKDPTVLKRMVVRIREKGGDLSRAFAIATAQAQRMGFLKPGSRELTAKGRAKEASYTQEQRDEAEEALAEYVELDRRVETKPTKVRAKAAPKGDSFRARQKAGSSRSRGGASMTVEGPGIEAAGITNIGLVRKNNEDDFFLAENLWVVSDGIGGAEGGEIASAACVRGAGEALASGNTGAKLLKLAAKSALFRMPRDFRGGATMVSATLVGDTLHVGNIGDSRAYLLAYPITLKRLTKDHQERGNVLTRWVGHRSPSHEPVLTKRKIDGMAKLLLCSDGIHGLVSDEEIRRALVDAKTPKAACAQLVKKALAAGGNDNATAIVVFFNAQKIDRKPTSRAKAPARAKTPSRAKAPAKPAPRSKTPAPRTPRATQAPARGSLASMRPMLAKVFTGFKPGHSYVAEPKIDGYRLLAKRTASGVTFETRTGHKEPYTTNLRVIRRSLEGLLKPGEVLDGEILVKDFENTALVRKEHLLREGDVVKKRVITKAQDEQLILDREAVFWAFDMPSVGGPWTARRRALASTMRRSSGSRGIKLMPTQPVANEAAARLAAKKLHAAEYEGAVIKDVDAPYSPGRRTDAFTKIKFHDDVTAKVVGFEEGKGKDAGRLGSLRVLYKGKEIGVGTGFSAKDRTNIWRNRGKLKGAKIDIIVGKNENGGKSKRPTTFVRFRQGD